MEVYYQERCVPCGLPYFTNIGKIELEVEFKLREDLSISNVDIVEALFIEVMRPREKI